MSRVFLDASVLFAAAYSTQGGARELLRRSLSSEVDLVTSQFAIEEAETTLLRKAPEQVVYFKALLETLEIEITPEPTKEELLAAASYTAMKDAPIIAAAIAAQADYLVTFDRKHLLNPPEVAKKSGLVIATPGEVLENL
jgi:predicted nucleic acid-binding protein